MEIPCQVTTVVVPHEAHNVRSHQQSFKTIAFTSIINKKPQAKLQTSNGSYRG